MAPYRRNLVPFATSCVACGRNVMMLRRVTLCQELKQWSFYRSYNACSVSGLHLLSQFLCRKDFCMYASIHTDTDMQTEMHTDEQTNRHTRIQIHWRTDVWTEGQILGRIDNSRHLPSYIVNRDRQRETFGDRDTLDREP